MRIAPAGENDADDLETETVYLTETGLSAEMGDDGNVGRGNRVNGVITPPRPTSLEAAPGTNPVSHVGKLYNFVATNAAERIYETLEAAHRGQTVLTDRNARLGTRGCRRRYDSS